MTDRAALREKIAKAVKSARADDGHPVVLLWGDAEIVADALLALIEPLVGVESDKFVLEAYKAHHRSFHPDCNIDGPTTPPRSTQRMWDGT